MALSPKQLALVHLAKKSVGMVDDDYRAMLNRVAGVTSARNLNDLTFRFVMEEFHRLGFDSTFAKHNLGLRVGMATPAQVQKIRDLWSDITDGEGTEQELGRWLEGHFKVSALQWLEYETARKVVGALISWNTKRQAKRAAAGQHRQD